MVRMTLTIWRSHSQQGARSAEGLMLGKRWRSQDGARTHSMALGGTNAWRGWASAEMIWAQSSAMMIWAPADFGAEMILAQSSEDFGDNWTELE